MTDSKRWLDNTAFSIVLIGISLLMIAFPPRTNPKKNVGREALTPTLSEDLPTEIKELLGVNPAADEGCFSQDFPCKILESRSEGKVIRYLVLFTGRHKIREVFRSVNDGRDWQQIYPRPKRV